MFEDHLVNRHCFGVATHRRTQFKRRTYGCSEASLLRHEITPKPLLTSSAAGNPRTNAITALTMAGSLLLIAPLKTALDRSAVRKANPGTLGNTVNKRNRYCRRLFDIDKNCALGSCDVLPTRARVRKEPRHWRFNVFEKLLLKRLDHGQGCLTMYALKQGHPFPLYHGVCLVRRRQKIVNDRLPHPHAALGSCSTQHQTYRLFIAWDNPFHLGSRRNKRTEYIVQM